MKKNCFLLSVLMVLCVTSCSQRKASAGSTELVVFAAASLTETMEQIAGLYKKAAPNVKLTFNFDSSGTLKTQIQEGAECDVFISAGQRQMDQLDSTASAAVNAEGLDFALQGSRINFLENRVTLCVPKGNPAGIKSFADLADKLAHNNILFATGNGDVPVGQYTQRILKFFNLDEDALAKSGKITYGANVKEVTAQIAASSVDCGVVYCTDAYSAGLEIADYATVEMCGQIIYPAAVMKSGKNPDAAAAFLEYLKTDEALDVFEKAGFAAARR
ncbi:MAG: molybdate ABC transporter substrate-binding protein [Treponema sp.]|jgi:molybdate transport system substrate-binding protein|nr:molybdate ABC transporter substrate-binding protein [Treponema sp.]